MFLCLLSLAVGGPMVVFGGYDFCLCSVCRFDSGIPLLFRDYCDYCSCTAFTRLCVI